MLLLGSININKLRLITFPLGAPADDMKGVIDQSDTTLNLTDFLVFFSFPHMKNIETHIHTLRQLFQMH